MALNSVTSFVGVLLLYLYAYRRPSALLYAAVPMVVAIVITFAIGALAFGTLSAASTGFAALLAGLGVDFMTVLYERYVDERNRGASVIEAVRTFMRHALPGVVVGALTTAATFYAFLATDFRGMTQLGFLTGSGILVFLLCVVFVLPALVVIIEQRREGKRTVKVHSAGSTPLLRFSLARPRFVIIAWVILVAIAGVAATGVRFSDNIQNLRSKGNEGVRLQELVTKKFGQSFEFMMYGVRGATASEAIAKTEAALPDLERIAQNRTIGSYQSIATFLPSEAQQQQVIQRLASGASDAFSVARIERTFRQALVDNGFRPNAYDDYLPLFGQALQQRQPLTIETLDRLGLAESVQRFMKKTPRGYMSIVYLYPTTGTWPRFLPEELQQFRRNHPEGALTGVNLVSQTLRTIVRADAIRASLVGFLVVFGLLWVGFPLVLARLSRVRAIRRRLHVHARVHGDLQPRVQLHEHLRRADAGRHGDGLRRVHAAAVRRGARSVRRERDRDRARRDVGRDDVDRRLRVIRDLALSGRALSRIRGDVRRRAELSRVDFAAPGAARDRKVPPQERVDARRTASRRVTVGVRPQCVGADPSGGRSGSGPIGESDPNHRPIRGSDPNRREGLTPSRRELGSDPIQPGESWGLTPNGPT
jgi:hypothetical protein